MIKQRCLEHKLATNFDIKITDLSELTFTALAK